MSVTRERERRRCRTVMLTCAPMRSCVLGRHWCRRSRIAVWGERAPGVWSEWRWKGHWWSASYSLSTAAPHALALDTLGLWWRLTLSCRERERERERETDR
jgi:hypothetical protein